jgi:hypothetical protein
VSFWVNGPVLTLIFSSSAQALFASINVVHAPVLYSLCAISVWLLASVVSVWQGVGTWRSANRHVGRGGNATWAALTRVMVVLGIVGSISALVTSGFPQLREFLVIAAGDQRLRGYTVRVFAGARALEVVGPIGFGLAEEISRTLSANPTVRVVLLDSPGGRISEAHEIARVIEAHSLVTYVVSRCESACAVVYVGGQERLIGPRAIIGLHQPSFPGAGAAESERERNRIEQYFRSRGVSQPFLDRAFLTPPGSMWRPSHDELIDAGLVHRTVSPEDVAIEYGVRRPSPRI